MDRAHFSNRRICALFTLSVTVLLCPRIDTQEIDALPLWTVGGHSGGPATAIAFHPYGHIVATGGGGGWINLWDVRTGNLVHTLRDQKIAVNDGGAAAQGVASLAFNRENGSLVSIHWDETLRIWDPVLGKPVSSKILPISDVNRAIFSRDGSTALIGSKYFTHGMIAIDTTSGRVLWETRDEEFNSGIFALSHDGGLLAFAKNPGKLFVWDIKSQRMIREYTYGTRQRPAHFSAADFSPDDENIVCSTFQGDLLCWQLSTGTLKYAITDAGDFSRTRQIAHSEDGEYLACTSDNFKTISIYSASTGRLDKELEKNKYRQFHVLAFSPERGNISSAYTSSAGVGSVDIWDVASGQLKITGRVHVGEIKSVTFHPRTNEVVSCGNDHTIRFWDPDTGIPVGSIHFDFGTYPYIAFAPSGERLAANERDGTIKLLDRTTLRETVVLKGHKGDVHAMAFTPDGTTLISGGKDSTVRIWDTDTGALIKTLSGHLDTIKSVAVSPNGEQAASASLDYTIRVWDIKTGRMIGACISSEYMSSIAFADNGRHIVSVDHLGRITVWDPETGEEVKSQKGLGALNIIDIDPKSNIAAVGGSAGKIILWDIGSGKVAKKIDLHLGEILTLAFNPDGRRLAVGMKYGRLMVIPVE